MAIELYLDNDNVVNLTGFQNSITAAYLNAATVTAELRDQQGNVIVASRPLSYVAASNGDYRDVWDKTLLPSASVTPGVYVLVTDAAEAGVDLHIESYVSVKVRDS